MLMIELYDSSRKYVSGIAEITGKDGGMICLRLIFT